MKNRIKELDDFKSTREIAKVRSSGKTLTRFGFHLVVVLALNR